MLQIAATKPNNIKSWASNKCLYVCTKFTTSKNDFYLEQMLFYVYGYITSQTI